LFPAGPAPVADAFGLYVLFDLALRIPSFPFQDFLIATVQVPVNFPALFYMAHFLGKRSLERLFETEHPDLNPVLAPLGVSPREAEIVELVLSRSKKRFRHGNSSAAIIVI